MNIVDVTPENVEEQTLFCVKDPKSPGFANKQQWFNKRYKEGLRLKILKDDKGKMIAFIEYLPADLAWRPVDAPNFLFIHCMYVYSNKDKGKGYGAKVVKACEDDARSRGMDGACVMTSKGSWMADKRLFEKIGFEEVDQRGRFELLSKTWNKKAAVPQLRDWTAQQKKYKGWHLVYADQCPWHEKSVNAIRDTAAEHGIEMQVKKITTAKQAKNAPSGFGVFNLLKDGKLLEDHYISETRFRNILKKEL